MPQIRGEQWQTWQITAALVKKLRDATGAGMMECKAALTEANGDLEEATTILRKRGPGAGGQEGRPLDHEGLIGHYIHMGGKIGVLVEVNCESDFVARTDDFQNLARRSRCTSPRPTRSTSGARTCRPTSLERERDIYRARWKVRTSRPQVIDKIVEGKLNSFYEQVCLLDQPSVRDPEDDHRPARAGGDREDWARTSRSPRFVAFKLGEELGVTTSRRRVDSGFQI